jgi:ABC-type Fe3+-siderophore transport system permease subunit
MREPFAHTWRIVEHGVQTPGRDCIMRSLWCAIFMLLLPITLAPAQPYRRVTELAPIRCSYGDIRKTVEYLEKRLQTGGSQQITFGSDKEGFQRRFKTASEIATERGLPGAIYEFDYRYEFDTHSSSSPPITGVTIRMNDFTRTIEVEGGDFDSVNDLLISLEDKFEPHQVFLAGSRFRFTAGFFCYLALSIVSLLLLASISNRLSRSSAIIWTSLAVLAASPVLFLILLSFLPVEVWFAGFRALSSNATFPERYSAEFTFLGFLITVIVVITPALRKLAKSIKFTKIQD